MGELLELLEGKEAQEGFCGLVVVSPNVGWALAAMAVHRRGIPLSEITHPVMIAKFELQENEREAPSQNWIVGMQKMVWRL